MSLIGHRIIPRNIPEFIIELGEPVILLCPAKRIKDDLWRKEVDTLACLRMVDEDFLELNTWMREHTPRFKMKTEVRYAKTHYFVFVFVTFPDENERFAAKVRWG